MRPANSFVLLKCHDIKNKSFDKPDRTSCQPSFSTLFTGSPIGSPGRRPPGRSVRAVVRGPSAEAQAPQRNVSRSHPARGCVPTPASLAAEREAVLAKERAALAERAAGNELGVYGGVRSDGWNGDFLAALSRSLPSSAGTEIAQDAAALAMVKALGDCRPSDPIEAMLIGQILSANATALELRQRAWRDRLPERQAALLNLADKSARTLAALTEALERHRARGRQRRSFARVERPGAYTCGCRPADFNPRSPKCDAGFQTIIGE